MDMVLVGGRGIIPCGIKVFTAGRKHWNNPDIAVHVGLVVEFCGQLFITEMLNKRGLALDSLEKYNGVKDKKKWILSIKRHYIYENSLVRRAAQERIALDLRYGLEYDVKGIASFVTDRVKHDKKKFFCSEYTYMQTAADGIMYKSAFADKVSPYDLHKSSGWYTVNNYNKEL